MTSASKENKALALLAAIVAGDAEVEDGVAELRNEGIESPGALLGTLAKGLRELQADQADIGQPLSLQHMGRETPPELVARIVQRVPEVPFILNGTMYDPEDVTRFNGQELHFVSSPDADHMLVVDDRALMATWRQFTYLEQYRHRGYPLTVAEPRSAVTFIQMRVPFPLTGFNEHINLSGAWKNLNKNRGFADLGSWSDEISSFAMVGTQVTELFEHENYMGQSFVKVVPFGTQYAEELNLHVFGWGDRASSVGTW